MADDIKTGNIRPGKVFFKVYLDGQVDGSIDLQAEQEEFDTYDEALAYAKEQATSDDPLGSYIYECKPITAVAIKRTYKVMEVVLESKERKKLQ